MKHEDLFDEKLTTIEFIRKFNTNKKCRKHIKDLMWVKAIPPSPYAPFEPVLEMKKGWYYGTESKLMFQVTTNSIFDHRSIDLKTWFLAIHLYSLHEKTFKKLDLKLYCGVSERDEQHIKELFKHIYKK